VKYTTTEFEVGSVGARPFWEAIRRGLFLGQ
jgi:hypothetical protein